MIEQLAPWVLALILSLAGGGVGWAQIKKHGATNEARKNAERDRDLLARQLKKHVRPLESDAEFGRTLERLLDDEDGLWGSST